MASSLHAKPIHHYHVFLASPNDVEAERRHVRSFFEDFNRSTAELWDVRFDVVDWENYGTYGVGRPQELITQQTLERYRSSLALVIGIMGQRFGTPTGVAGSGSEEEFDWAIRALIVRLSPPDPATLARHDEVKRHGSALKRELLHLLRDSIQDPRVFDRCECVQLLARHWPDEATHGMLLDFAVNDPISYVRRAAFDEVTDEEWRHSLGRKFFEDCVLNETNFNGVRQRALRILTETWPGPATDEFVARAAAIDA